MGVSGFFRKLVESYPTTHFWDPKLRVEYLFFDFNGSIYDSLEKLKTDKWSFPKDTAKFEKKLIDQVLIDCQDTVMTVQPSKLVYIAIDGPPPFAKMKQQRDRRCFGVWMNNFMKDTFDIDPFGWDRSNISPGTNFMYKLDMEFRRRLRQKTLLKEYNVVYDGPRRPMEAEHKFMPLLDSIKPNENVVIVSKDADQIILSMKYLNHNIYILREVKGEVIESKYPENQKWFYLDVKKFTELISEKYLTEPTDEDKVQFIEDMTFMSFLEGNDFVPSLPHLFYKLDYLESPLKAYKDSLVKIYNGHYTINSNNLQKLIASLAEREWLLYHNKRNKVHQFIEKYEKGDPRTVEKCNFDNPEQLEHVEIYCPSHPLFDEFFNIWTKMYKHMNPHQWKRAYYDYFFGSRYDIDEICYEYSRALLFNLRYYFADTIYWRYQYPYPVAPIPSDYAKYLALHSDVFDKITFNDGGPVNPFVQLAYILPIQLQSTLPSIFTEKYLNKRNYPEKGKLNLLTGDKLIYIDMDLPPIHLGGIISDYNKTKHYFNDQEKERDKLEKEPLFFWK